MAVLIGMLILLTSSLPNARGAPPCLIQNLSLTFPSSVMVGEQVNVLTHVQATCVQWPPMSTAYVIRNDLTDTVTRYVLSTSTYQVGYAQTDIDIVLATAATASTYSGA